MIHDRKYVPDFAAYHAGNNLRFGPLAGGTAADSFPIAQNRNAFADAKHFMQLVRNVDHCHSPRLQLPENDKECFDFCVIERRGGLVKYQNPGLMRKRFGYFD